MSLLLPFDELLALFNVFFLVADHADFIGQHIYPMMPLIHVSLYKSNYLSLIILLTYLAHMLKNNPCC